MGTTTPPINPRIEGCEHPEIPESKWQSRHDYGEKIVRENVHFFLTRLFKVMGKKQKKILPINDWLLDTGEMIVVWLYSMAKQISPISHEDKDGYRLSLAEFVLIPIQGMMAAMNGLGIEYMPVIENIYKHLEKHKPEAVADYERRFPGLAVRGLPLVLEYTTYEKNGKKVE